MPLTTEPVLQSPGAAPTEARAPPQGSHHSEKPTQHSEVGRLGSGRAWAGPTCPILHVLHLHDLSVDSTPEDVQGAIDGFGPLGGFLAPSDPERQREVSIPYLSPPRASVIFNRVIGCRTVAQKDTRGQEQGRNWLRSVAFWLVLGDLSKSLFHSQPQVPHLENGLIILLTSQSYF